MFGVFVSKVWGVFAKVWGLFSKVWGVFQRFWWFFKGFGWVFKGLGGFLKLPNYQKILEKALVNTMVPMERCSRSLGGMGTRKGDPTGEDNIQGWSIIF